MSVLLKVRPQKTERLRLGVEEKTFKIHGLCCQTMRLYGWGSLFHLSLGWGVLCLTALKTPAHYCNSLACTNLNCLIFHSQQMYLGIRGQDLQRVQGTFSSSFSCCLGWGVQVGTWGSLIPVCLLLLFDLNCLDCNFFDLTLEHASVCFLSFFRLHQHSTVSVQQAEMSG